MTRRSIVLVVLATVVLAGCAGTQGTGTPTAETPTEDASGVESEEIPGVSNESLTNATALVQANGETLVETGARLKVVQTEAATNTESVFTIGSTGSYTLTTTRSASNGQSGTIDYWSNETATYVRTQMNGETQYRSIDRQPGTLDSFNRTLETYLAAGTFTVSNESTDPTTVVLTAEEFTVPDDSGLLGDASSLSGRLVLSQSGQVQNLTITGQQNGESVALRYELLQPVIERATKPAWVSEVPASAKLNPDLTIDVRNSSFLVIENQGGDPVPRNATIAVETNGTSGTATFETALEGGETRYAYFQTSDGTLTLSADQPTADMAASVDSPLSVRVTTSDDVSLYSASMGWASASADAESGSSGTAGDE